VFQAKWHSGEIRYMRFLHLLANVFDSLFNWIISSDKCSKKKDEFTKHEYLRPPSRRISWEKLERDAQVFSMRGWTRLQEAKANDPNPDVLDQQICQLCRTYVNSSLSERIRLRKRISSTLCSALDYFAWRMAVRAIRNKSEEAIKLGLAAISLEDIRFDMRDTLGWLALIYYAAVRIRCDVQGDFQQAATISSEQTNELIKSFLSTQPELRDISAFGFCEGVSEQGPTLVNASR
jgi:hypothetical protein